jgi:hypothetical protein
MQLFTITAILYRSRRSYDKAFYDFCKLFLMNIVFNSFYMDMHIFFTVSIFLGYNPAFPIDTSYPIALLAAAPALRTPLSSP